MGSVVWWTQEEIDAQREVRAWEELRAERDRRIQAIEWMRWRHLDELALGLPTSLTAEQYTDLLAHIQTLRDVTEQPGAPDHVIWPELPWEVEAP